MLTGQLGVQTVTVIRPGTDTVDAWGNPVDGWGSATETDVSGCSVQPDHGEESIDGEQSVEDLWKVWAPIATDVVPTDRVRHAGVVYDVASEVMRWDFEQLSHVAFKMRRIEAR